MDVLEELDQQQVEDPELAVFWQQFKTWISIQLQNADGIEVTGNL
ncbi:hypothetical protein [Paenibacillus kyungheensis]